MQPRTSTSTSLFLSYLKRQQRELQDQRIYGIKLNSHFLLYFHPSIPLVLCIFAVIAINLRCQKTGGNVLQSWRRRMSGIWKILMSKREPLHKMSSYPRFLYPGPSGRRTLFNLDSRAQFSWAGGVGGKKLLFPNVKLVSCRTVSILVSN